ncbi:MAG TPA: thiamine pyrophosphate-dependent enzyme [Caulobacteraceae bacterium]
MNKPVPLSLHVPEPEWRPGQPIDFQAMKVPAAGILPRPDIGCRAEDTNDLAHGLIRVLDDAGEAVGPWAPDLAPEVLQRGLRCMLLVRAFDERMYRQQRQGKTSFYVKCTGEEAVAVAQTLALDPGDMCFPTYRQQGALITRGYPIVEMMNQIYSNARDPMQGRQLPVMYSSKAHGVFTISGNLATQFSQAVGWAMASAYKGDTRLAYTYIGDGSTAEGDFHQALLFATVYRAPVLLNIVNNQWAISAFHGIAGDEQASFASRGLGYGLPSLRVDGNDFLAVHAVTTWAAERARANLGATLIELFTYRASAHSTSDDPNRYRSAEEGANWPLGDPIERLKQHMIRSGAWSDAQHAALAAEVLDEVRAAGREAEKVGVFGVSRAPLEGMFEGVYEHQPWHLARQEAEVLEDAAEQAASPPGKAP